MRKRVLYSLILLLFLVIIVVVLIRMEALKRSPRPQVQRLPDGTVLKLQAVTYGKQHRFKLREGSLWNRLGFGPRTEFTTQYDRLFFWFTQSPSAGAELKNYRATMSDEHGCRFVIIAFRGPSGTRESIVRHHLMAETFPRRGQAIVLRFYDRKSGESVAEFTIPNPAPGPHPTWIAEPYPITKRDGDLAFALVELSAALGGEHFPAAGASFNVTQNGRPTREWEPVEIIVSDATGNAFTYPLARHFPYNRGGKVSFPGLCPYETAWKLRVEFSRTTDSSFSADQLWTVRGVAVPARDTLIRSTSTSTRDGAMLQLLGIAGAGHVSWSESYGSSKTMPYVRLRVSPGDNLRPTLQATDDTGRKITVSSTRYSDASDGGRICDFNLEIPSDAKTLDLTFAVHRSRFAEFIAEPSRP